MRCRLARDLVDLPPDQSQAGDGRDGDTPANFLAQPLGYALRRRHLPGWAEAIVTLHELSQQGRWRQGSSRSHDSANGEQDYRGRAQRKEHRPPGEIQGAPLRLAACLGADGLAKRHRSAFLAQLVTHGTLDMHCASEPRAAIGARGSVRIDGAAFVVRQPLVEVQVYRFRRQMLLGHDWPCAFRAARASSKAASRRRRAR
ncbi:MAG: hypothetical protein U0822_25690 [Anaerolineae bacterium]